MNRLADNLRADIAQKMADPLSIATTVVGIIQYLVKVAEEVKENKEECKLLCRHAQLVMDIIQVESRGLVPPRLNYRLQKLASSLIDVSNVAEELSKRSFLQRTLWRSQMSAKIQFAYKELQKAKEEFHDTTLIDLSKMQFESDLARQYDAKEVQRNFEQSLSNDQNILEQLQVQNRQMQEAMVSIQRRLAQLPASNIDEVKFLQHGLHALQRRSGNLLLRTEDEYVITSLEIIIYHERKLGEGGFASVYEGDWNGTRVAVKMLEQGVPSTAIQKEVDVWKNLRHPNILEFFGACPIADPPFMVCAFKENGDAVDYLRRYPFADRRRLLAEAARGLAYLHRNNVVHGDLKGTNILIDGHGQACLADFGLSKVKHHTATIRTTRNQSDGYQIGTARWMSPEQMQTGVTSKETDIYSFGMTMYEIFTDSPPFASTPDSMLLAIICDRKVTPPRPTEPEVEARGLDDAVWEVMTRSWAYEPKSRQLAAVLSETLKNLAGGHIGGGSSAGQTSPPGNSRPLPTPPRLSPLVPALDPGIHLALPRHNAEWASASQSVGGILLGSSPPRNSPTRGAQSNNFARSWSFPRTNGSPTAIPPQPMTPIPPITLPPPALPMPPDIHAPLMETFVDAPRAPDIYAPRESARKKAVCIGISYSDDYMSQYPSKARSMRTFLITHFNYNEENTLVLTDAGLSHKSRLEGVLKDKYPYALICNGSWKLEQIGIALYPRFKQTVARRCKNQGKPLPDWMQAGDSKLDPIVLDDEHTVGDLSRTEVTGEKLQKRKRQSKTASSHKKQRPALDVPDFLADIVPPPTAPLIDSTSLGSPVSGTLPNGASGEAGASSTTATGPESDMVATQTEGGATKTSTPPATVPPPVVTSLPSAITEPPASVTTPTPVVVAPPFTVAAPPATVAVPSATVAAPPTTIAAPPATVTAPPATVTVSPRANAGEYIDDSSTMQQEVPAAPRKKGPSALTGKKTYQPAKPHTARNIFGREWKLGHPNGTVEDFNAAWHPIEHDKDQLQIWAQKAKDLKATIAVERAAALSSSSTPASTTRSRGSK